MSFRSYFFCFVILLFGLSSCSSSSDNSVKTILDWDIAKADLDEYFDEQLASKEEKSLSVALINNGELVYTFHRGLINEATQKSASDTSRFNLGSGSRPILYFFAMTLVEDGSLDLDKPLVEYIEVPEIDLDSELKDITARSVIANKTGLSMLSSSSDVGIVNYEIEAGAESSDAEIGLNYLMEAIMEIEQVDRGQLDSIFQIRVAIPLGMRSTHFIQSSDSSVLKSDFNLEGNLLDYSNWMIGIMNGVGLSEENMNTLLDTIILEEEKDSSDLAKIAIGDYEFYTNTGLSDGTSRYFSFDRNIDWGFIVFSGEHYASELGFAAMLYLVMGSQFNLIVTLTSLLILGLGIGLVYGIYRFFKFVLN